MSKYVCLQCGYVYDPKEGDAKGNIPPGTKGDDLPEDWTCPKCGGSQKNFAKKE